MPGQQSLAVGGGVTAPLDARHATGALLAVQGPTELDIRTGVAWGPGTTTLVTGTAATGQMTVQIGVHHAVTTRGSGNGPYVGPTLTAATTVNIAAAPGSGSRIDVVYVKQQDGNSGVPSPDVTTAPLYGVLQGAVSTGTPVKPDLSTTVGAEELATVQVSAGALSTNGANVTITNTSKLTVARGARVPVRNQAARDALTAFVGLEVYRLDTGQVQLCTATGPTTWTTTYPAPSLTTAGVDLTLGSGLANVGSYKHAHYYKCDGVVFLGGIVQASAAQAVGAILATLPAGYRPPTTLGLLVPSQSGGTMIGSRIDLGTDGTLKVAVAIAASTYLYLDGLCFDLS